MEEIVAGVKIPDTPMVRQATVLVSEAADTRIFDHSRRVYLWGQLYSRQAGIAANPELCYVAAMFHDLGCTNRYGRGGVAYIDGANAAWAFLLDNELCPPRDARRVWLAIAAQDAPRTPDHVEPEAVLLSAGIDADLRGRHLDAFDCNHVHQVLGFHTGTGNVGHPPDGGSRDNLAARVLGIASVITGLGAGAVISAGTTIAAPLEAMSAVDVVHILQQEGLDVRINGTTSVPLSECTVTGVHGMTATAQADPLL